MQGIPDDDDANNEQEVRSFSYQISSVNIISIIPSPEHFSEPFSFSVLSFI